MLFFSPFYNFRKKNDFSESYFFVEKRRFFAKRWASKNCWGQFFRCVCSRRFFSSPLCGPKNAVNFLDREGQKRGATRGPRQERFPLYATQWCQRCKNVTLCQRVTETPCYIPTVDYYFYVCF